MDQPHVYLNESSEEDRECANRRDQYGGRIDRTQGAQRSWKLWKQQAQRAEAQTQSHGMVQTY